MTAEDAPRAIAAGAAAPAVAAPPVRASSSAASAELGMLRRAVDDAAARSRPRAPSRRRARGIGKTRTAEELAEYAGARGARVVWGRCWEGDGAPPFWPWVQIVRACVATLAREALARCSAAASPTSLRWPRRCARSLPIWPAGGRSRRGALPPLRQHRAALRASGAPARRWRWCSTTCTAPTTPRCSCCSSSRASCAICRCRPRHLSRSPLTPPSAQRGDHRALRDPHRALALRGLDPDEVGALRGARSADRAEPARARGAAPADRGQPPLRP